MLFREFLIKNNTILFAPLLVIIVKIDTKQLYKARTFYLIRQYLEYNFHHLIFLLISETMHFLIHVIKNFFYLNKLGNH